MKLVIEDIQNTILLVIRTKDRYAQKMIQLAKKLNIDNNVKFTDWLNRDDIKKHFLLLIFVSLLLFMVIHSICLILRLEQQKN